MKTLVWVLTITVLALWSLVAWITHGLVGVAGGLVSSNADIIPADPLLIEWASWLASAGTGVGEWLVVAVACAQAGAVLLPIVTIYGAKELRFILRQSHAVWLFTPEHWRGVDYAAVVQGCGGLPELQRHVMLGAEFDALEAEGDIVPFVSRKTGDLAVLVYTSGTTADPKGVMHSGRTILAELDSTQEMRGQIEDEAMLSPWPPGHVAGGHDIGFDGSMGCGPGGDAGRASPDHHLIRHAFPSVGHDRRCGPRWPRSYLFAALYRWRSTRAAVAG